MPYRIVCDYCAERDETPGEPCSGCGNVVVDKDARIAELESKLLAAETKIANTHKGCPCTSEQAAMSHAWRRDYRVVRRECR